MPYLSIKNKNTDIYLEFKDKYIFVQGDSGEGKSLLVSMLSDEETISRDVDTDLDIRILNKLTINDFKNWNNGELIVTDEVYARKYLSSFKTKNCYFLIVTRKIFKNINFSYRSIYNLVRNDTKSKLEKAYTFSESKVDNYDYIFTEDSGYGYEFIKKCLNGYNVIGCEGKSNIKNVMSSILNGLENKKVLLICDGGGIGTDISIIANYIRKLAKHSIEVEILLPECFEHILLCSGYIKYDKDIFNHFNIKYNDTESFCETKLYQFTKGTELECSHETGTMSECWYKQCNDCNNKCDYEISTCKFDHVLKGGPAEILLELRNIITRSNNSNNNNSSNSIESLDRFNIFVSKQMNNK